MVLLNLIGFDHFLNPFEFSTKAHKPKTKALDLLPHKENRICLSTQKRIGKPNLFLNRSRYEQSIRQQEEKQSKLFKDLKTLNDELRKNDDLSLETIELIKSFLQKQG